MKTLMLRLMGATTMGILKILMKISEGNQILVTRLLILIGHQLMLNPRQF
jgi:hypothetical protein